jgi:6-phosphogluconolactonase
MAAPSLLICEDSDALAARAADLVARCARDALRERGRFTFVLAGGSTPEKTYTLMAKPDRRAAIDWSRTHVFFGDERLVPPDDPRSNFGMARRTLLSRVHVPPSQVFAVPAHEKTAPQAAAAYARDLARFFGTGVDDPPPRFDLVLLGMGSDGHTASLFPGAPATRVDDAWVTWSPPGVLAPDVDRITLTYRVLNAARRVAFLVAGDEKAAALRDVLEGNAPREQRPAAGIRPADGTVIWLVDEKAAGLLSRRGENG